MIDLKENCYRCQKKLLNDSRDDILLDNNIYFKGSLIYVQTILIFQPLR